MKTEKITYRQWDNYSKKIEKKNLEKHKTSLTFTSISNRCNHFIKEIQPDHKLMIVEIGWKEEMKKYLK